MNRIKKLKLAAILATSLACGQSIVPNEEIYHYQDLNGNGYYDTLRHRDQWGNMTQEPLAREYTKAELKEVPVLSVYGYKKKFD